jgi:hypothetical protein
MPVTSLGTFPITGSNVSAVLGELYLPEQLWILADIETLSDADALVLGDLWRRVRVGPVTLSTRELCDALGLANQVVSLDMRLKADLSVELLIEDGVKVVCSLG